MKKYLKVFAALIAPICILSFSFENSNGKAGHTGSPGEQTCARSGCHDTYALNSGPGVMTLTVVGADNNTYVAGQTYTVTVNIAQSGSNLFGFNIEALQPSGANAGTLNAGAGSQVLNVMVGANSRRNLTHTLGAGASMNQHTFTFTWVAPTDGSNVTFYLSGNAANSSGNDSGDYIYTSTLNLTEAIPVSAPEISISDSQLCSGETTVLSATPQAGVTIEWFNDQNVSVGFGESLTVSPTSSACYSAVAMAGSNSVPSVNSVCIEVNQPLDASFTDLPATVCSGEAAIEVSALNPGGEFTGLDANAQFNPNQAPGLYAISYVIQNGACLQSSTQSIEVLASPDASFTGLNPAYCSNEDPVQASPLQTGGVFSGFGVSSSGLFSPLNANVGANEVTYTIELTNGCSDAYTSTVFVYDTLNASFTDLPANICSQTDAIVLIPVNPGGVFSGDGLINDSWDPSLAGPGEHIIHYALNLGQCSESSSDTVTVLLSPDPEFGELPDTLCGLSFFPFPLLSFNPETVVTGDAVADGVFMPNLAQYGYNVVVAQLLGDNGCLGSVMDSIWIQQLPEALLTINLQNELEVTPSDQSYVWLNCITGETLSETTMNTFQPDAAGNYQVLVNDGICGVLSNCVDFIPSGVSDQRVERFKLYPNPGSAYFTIQVQQPTDVEVFNALGERMISIHIQQQFNVDAFDWPAGIYQVVLRNGSGLIQTARWVK